METMGDIPFHGTGLNKTLYKSVTPPRVNFNLQSICKCDDFQDGIRPLGAPSVFNVHIYMGHYFDDYYTQPKVPRSLEMQ